jgi:hypothetical protein
MNLHGKHAIVHQSWMGGTQAPVCIAREMRCRGYASSGVCGVGDMHRPGLHRHEYAVSWMCSIMDVSIMDAQYQGCAALVYNLSPKRYNDVHAG